MKQSKNVIHESKMRKEKSVCKWKIKLAVYTYLQKKEEVCVSAFVIDKTRLCSTVFKQKNLEFDLWRRMFLVIAE